MNNSCLTSPFLEKIEKAALDFGMLRNAYGILAGLSGGADSTALLICLKALSEKYGFKLAAVHVNHMIRGAEAVRDEEFSRTLCLKYGVEFFSVSVNIPEISRRTGESLELCARNERYRVFHELCASLGYNRIATAHNADDNAETMLMNLVRGTGAKGLCGIPPIRDGQSGEIKIIRPLTSVLRDEIERFLSQLGQDYVTDSTNLSDDCTRNRIRHRILPEIKLLNPSAVKTLSEVSSLLYADCSYLDAAAKNQKTSDLKVLSEIDECLRKRIIASLYRENASNGTMLEKKHIDAVNAMILRSAQDNGRRSSVSLPGKIRAFTDGGKLCFGADSREKAHKSEAYRKALSLGTNELADSGFLIVLSDKPEKSPDNLSFKENIYKKYNTGCLYSDRIINSLYARNRREGDKFKLNGLTKSVKRLLCERKIPLGIRNRLPFICLNDEIIYIPGVGVGGSLEKSERFAVQIDIYEKLPQSNLEE